MSCNDIDLRSLHVVLDGVYFLHGCVYQVGIYAPARLWTNVTARRSKSLRFGGIGRAGKLGGRLEQARPEQLGERWSPLQLLRRRQGLGGRPPSAVPDSTAEKGAE